MNMNAGTALRCLALLALTSAAGWCAGPNNVLVIINDKSPESKMVGDYYASKRKIPSKNICRISCPAEESIDTQTYRTRIEDPVREYLKKTGLNKQVDYLVLTKGVPIRIGGGRSVDGLLMCMDKNLGFDFAKLTQGVRNPYYGRKHRFSRESYGMYLATRLDGYTVEDAKALVDRSLAAKPRKGTFLIDMASNRNSGSYKSMNWAMAASRDLIQRKGYEVELDVGSTFVGGLDGLMGYFSWGSNDSSFDRDKYKSNKFHPGAIAETAVSTSARTFKPTDGGQSLIADLIEAGITGVKGYVSEPYLSAIAEPQILFDAYLSGYNLAESFYMASRFIYWKDLVIGDPLCAPYAKN